MVMKEEEEKGKEAPLWLPEVSDSGTAMMQEEGKDDQKRKEAGWKVRCEEENKQSTQGIIEHDGSKVRACEGMKAIMRQPASSGVFRMPENED